MCKGRWHFYLYIIINLFYYVLKMFLFCFCLVSLHNGGFHPRYYTVDPMLPPSGNSFKCHEEVCICSLWSHLNVLTFFPLTGGCSEGLDAFRSSFKNQYCSWLAERGNICSACPRSRLIIWSRETGSVVPSRVSSFILHTAAEEEWNGRGGQGWGCTWGDCSKFETFSTRVDWTNPRTP